MEKEKKKYKIRTIKGRIITLTVEGFSETHVYGKDKFGTPVILNRNDIDSLISQPGDSN